MSSSSCVVRNMLQEQNTSKPVEQAGALACGGHHAGSAQEAVHHQHLPGLDKLSSVVGNFQRQLCGSLWSSERGAEAVICSWSLGMVIFAVP